MEATVRLKRPFSLHRYRPEERVSGITAALDRKGTHRTSNSGAASEVGAVGGLLRCQTEIQGYLHGNRAPRFGRIEPHPARQPVCTR